MTLQSKQQLLKKTMDAAERMRKVREASRLNKATINQIEPEPIATLAGDVQSSQFSSTKR